MIGKVNHIAIAVNDIEKASEHYRHVLGAKVEKPIEQLEHGVKVAFIQLPNVKIELLEPLGEKSPIRKFLYKNPNGGIHHICYEVDNIDEAVEKLKSNNTRILGDGKTKIGAHGKPILFLHPADSQGVLIELEQK